MYIYIYHQQVEVNIVKSNDVKPLELRFWRSKEPVLHIVPEPVPSDWPPSASSTKPRFSRHVHISSIAGFIESRLLDRRNTPTGWG